MSPLSRRPAGALTALFAGLLLSLPGAAVPGEGAGDDSGASRVTCHAESLDVLRAIEDWSTGGRQAVYDPNGLWEALGDPWWPGGRMYYLGHYLAYEDGIVRPLRTGKEVALYNAIKQFAATQPDSARLDFERILEMALDASADSSGRANVSVAMLTAHNVVRVLARPKTWAGPPAPDTYGHPPTDPMTPIFEDLTSLAPGTLPSIMKARGVVVQPRPGERCEGTWAEGLFARDKGLFRSTNGALNQEWNGGSHYYYWAGAVGQDQLGDYGVSYGYNADLDAKEATNAGEQGRAQLVYYLCGSYLTGNISEEPSFQPSAPLRITGMSGNSTSVNNAPKTDAQLQWTGTAVPPLTVVTGPSDCPPGGCVTMTFTFPTLANPLVLNDAEWCWGYRESFHMRYRTVISDSAGHRSEPFFTEGDCVVPKTPAAPDPCEDSLPPGSSGTPGSCTWTAAADRDDRAASEASPDVPGAFDAATTPSLSYTVTHFAGSPGGAGVVAGTGHTARLFAPAGIATDGKGTILVTDAGTSTIRKISADGTVSALMGQPGVRGSTDGTGDGAQFDTPLGVAIDAAGIVWIADTGNHTIRRASNGNIAWTYAGAAGKPGSTDATGDAARFLRPAGITVAPAGVIYVADTGNHTIRKIVDRVVTTLAGKPGEAGSADGTGSSARFRSPTALAVDGAGNLWVADTDNHLVRKVTPTGAVTTVAGQAGVPGTADGVGSAAEFSWPMGIAIDAAGFVYVTDTHANTLRRVSPTGTVVTLAGVAGQSGSTDGIADRARFSLPFGVAADPSGVLYVADSANHTVRVATATGTVTTLAGSPPTGGWRDGVAAEALFASPASLGYDALGNLFIADADNHVVRRMRAGVVTTFAGLAGEAGSADGSGTAARFNRPAGLVVDRAGNLLVADSRNHTIRLITPAGDVSTLAGSPGTPGTSDGPGPAARFNEPWGLAIDTAGTLYVADTWNGAIRKVSPAGAVLTLAGKPGESGSVDGTGQAARFAFPMGVAVDSSGNVFVADTGNATLRRITPAGAVTTIAGVAGERGGGDIMAATARFQSPSALAFDADGFLWVADGHTVRRVDQAGSVILTLMGLPTMSGSDDGVGTAARFDRVGGLVTYEQYVLIADTGNDCLRLGSLGDAILPTITSVTPGAGAVGGGTRITITGQNFTASGLGVKVGGKPLNDVQVLNNRTLTGVAPAGTTGARDVEVITFAGRAVWPRAFTYTPYTSYLAEGATIAPFTMELAMLNPGDTKATGTVRFAKPDGTTVDWGLEVPPHTRVTWWPGEKTGARNAEFSTTVESDQPLVVDRTMTWDADGYGSHAETGVVSPVLTWYLAEGATHSGFDLFYLIQNPNTTAANVEVSFLLPSGTPLVRTYQVPAKSRFTIWVDAIPELGNTDVSAVVSSTNRVPVIVERAMYLTGQGRLFNAGHESAGVTEPATEWLLAEGATGPYFDLFILVANPSDREADIEAWFLLPDGTTLTKRYLVGAKSRFNIWADVEEIPSGSGQFPLADTAVSTSIASRNGVKVVVERAMWWPRQASEWQEAHNSPGATRAGTKWALAAGEVSSDARAVETFVLMANTSTYAGEAVLTLVFEDGTTASRSYVLPPSSRTNAWVSAEFPESAGRRFGAIIESVVPAGGVWPAEIVVERAMYSNAGGMRWAAGTNALGTKIH
jgi:sugar lactone lactonase YvrE